MMSRFGFPCCFGDISHPDGENVTSSHQELTSSTTARGNEVLSQQNENLGVIAPEALISADESSPAAQQSQIHMQQEHHAAGPSPLVGSPSESLATADFSTHLPTAVNSGATSAYSSPGASDVLNKLLMRSFANTGEGDGGVGAAEALLSDLTNMRAIGCGGFGVVYLVSGAE